MEIYIMSGRKVIGFSVYIELPSQIKKVPTIKNVVNNFDYTGELLSLWRLSGESNVDFKERLWDVRVHPGGPDYEGVLNNIGRELGMIRAKTLTIDLRLDSGGSPLALNPRVDILANKVMLYSDWRPDGTSVLDREIRFYQVNDTGYYLNNLVSAINESPYFISTIEQGIRSNLHSFLLVRGTSDRLVVDDYVRTDKLQELDNTYLIQGSLNFTEKGIFDTEVSGSPSSDGEYTVNYTTGIVESYDMPSGEGTCSYHYGKFPMEIDHLPMQIFSFQDDNFQEELFDKDELDSGEEINSLLNVEGTEIYHQLYMNTKVFWGD
jgi:hypothetical protein